MPEHLDPELTPPAQNRPGANRAERRAKRGSRSAPTTGNSGKVQPVRFDHATSPRQFAAHRRG